ncbi:hypothetical protein CVIRNUC_001042 [Coccomyxa viridis]|uniref:Septin-type G domain-containing protein n=1 Tax=Coccomyxa viridis TaxID=1274662 RepID=A0AAV1HVG0_9CHLO|nr:hypothetical protein CVIRNUC_001042 [Coccomyxa viridis]
MMVAEGGSEVGSPRSDLSESQHWEVIGPHSDSSNAHLIAPAARDLCGDAPLTLHAATERAKEDSQSDEELPIPRALVDMPPVRCSDDDEVLNAEEAQKRWAQAEKYAADLRKASSASPPKMRAKYTSRCFKMLVAGAPGTGKTSFIQNLASAYGSQDDGPSMMCHSTSTEGLVESFSIEPTALEDFKEAPDSLCTRVLLTDEDAKVHYNIFIQMPNRDVPMTSFEDTRVDICLYFIPPHALLPADIATIQRLGRTVPIVPIISKGDAMTKQELQQFKQHISKALDIGNPDSCIYTFLPEDIQEAGLESMTQVFSVISSCIVDESVGRHWPVRSYPWGMAEALSSSHSDVPALKRLLIELSFDDIKACTEASYHNFRKERLSVAEAGAAPQAEEPKGPYLVPATVQTESAASLASQPAAAEHPASVPQHEPHWVKIHPSLLEGAERSRPGSSEGPAQKKSKAERCPRCPKCTHCAHPNLSALTEASLFLFLILALVVGIAGLIFLLNAMIMRQAEGQQDNEAAHTGKHLSAGCGPELDMEALYAALPSRNRELWALIRLTEAMAQPDRENAAVCAQERGALAYQASLARAEMAAQEAGQLGRLRADIAASLQNKAQRLRTTTTRLASLLGHRIEHSMHKLSSKMPIQTEKGKLHVDLKALGQVLWRSTIVHIFR